MTTTYLNLTGLPTTPEQKAAGVVDLSTNYKVEELRNSVSSELLHVILAVENVELSNDLKNRLLNFLNEESVIAEGGTHRDITPFSDGLASGGLSEYDIQGVMYVYLLAYIQASRIASLAVSDMASRVIIGGDPLLMFFLERDLERCGISFSYDFPV